MQHTEEQRKWNQAYDRGGNICFYPHEEIIRFVNRYVRKREGIDVFRNVMNLPQTEWESFKSLDLGCGIGRHVKFLDEFGLNPYGIDLSDTAVCMGQDWLRGIGKEDLAQKMCVGSVTELPYEDETFWICVSCGTLDSMHREIAKQGIDEEIRVLKKNGLMYLDLIMDVQDKDVIVDFGYEKDTVQSYYTVESITELLEENAEMIDFKIIAYFDKEGAITNRRAHLVIRKK